MGSKIKHTLAKVYWFLFKPKTFGVKCVVRSGDEILMIKSSYGGWKNWMFPGGGINKGETPEETAKRELKEEVGVEGFNFQKVGEYTSTKEYKGDTVTVFICDAVSKELKIDPKEILEAKWFLKNNLPEISEYSKNILGMWQQEEV